MIAMLVVSALGKMRLEDHCKFEVILDNTVRSSFKKNK